MKITEDMIKIQHGTKRYRGRGVTGGRKRGHENLCVPAMRLKQKSEKENGKKGERIRLENEAAKM